MTCSVHRSPDDPSERRNFLSSIAGAGALLAFPGQVRAAQVGDTMGELYVNGQRAAPGTRIQPGDRVLTGPESSITFNVGPDAFRLRQLTSLQIDGRGFIAGLRILTGGLLGVFGKGGPRVLRTATVTAGIRGTGIYVEASSIVTYFCTCYGAVDLECVAYKSKKDVRADNHQANYIYGRVEAGRSIVEAPVVNHTNAELMELEKMVGRVSPLG